MGSLASLRLIRGMKLHRVIIELDSKIKILLTNSACDSSHHALCYKIGCSLVLIIF